MSSPKNPPGKRAQTPLASARPKAAQAPKNPKTGIAHRNLPLLLLQAREAVIGRFRPLLNEQGLTEQQWRILRALLERGPLEPREIVRLCGISSPSLAGVLARMDDLGLVLRERVDSDQRRVMVSISPKAQAQALAMAPTIEAIYAGIEAQVGKPLVDDFYRLLDQMLDKLSPPEGDGGVAEER